MKNKKIPREILIGDSIWKIKFTKNIPSAAKDLHGLTDPGDCVVYIKPGLSYEDKLNTLIHEFLHCLEFEYGFELDHKLVYKIAEGLAKLWIDNF